MLIGINFFVEKYISKLRLQDSWSHCVNFTPRQNDADDAGDNLNSVIYAR